MSKEDIVALGLRLLAVTMVLKTLELTLEYVRFFSEGANIPWIAALASLLVVVTFAVAIALWVFPLRIARKLLPAKTETHTPISTSVAELEELAFTAVGIWIFANALADVIYWLVFFQQVKFEAPEFSFANDPYQFTGVIITGVEFLLGLALLLGSRGILGVIKRFRYAGKDFPET